MPVNRLVAGSNPARGASSFKNLGIVFQVLYSHSSAARPSSSETPTTRDERHGLEDFARRAAHWTPQAVTGGGRHRRASYSALALV